MVLEALIIGGSIVLGCVYIGNKIDKFEDQTLESLFDQLPDDGELEVPEKDSLISDGKAFGSEDLHRKNSSLDERARQLQEELGSEYGVFQEHAKHRAGEVYDIDHALVDATYIAVPKEEYAK